MTEPARSQDLADRVNGAGLFEDDDHAAGAALVPLPAKAALRLSPAARAAAGQAWQSGGHMLLSAWLRAHLGRSFGVKEYGEAATAARQAVGDVRDYREEEG